MISPGDARLRAAYAACARLAREHYENFPVASLLLPRAMRPHVAAVYAFARSADDFADEGTRSPQERLRLLDDWSSRLHREAADDVFVAVQNTIREKRLPISLFEDLLSAFKQDVTVRRYATWTDLLDYCRRSANPVGRLVLRIAGHDDLQLDRASDALCTALQLANFWQDFERDWDKGRLYVPRADVDAAGAKESDLDARRMTPAWRAALAGVAARTRVLFDDGRAVADGVSGRLRWELRFTWLGGVRILDRLERARYDVFQDRPALGPSDAPAILWGALAWPPGRTTHARAKA
jgi:squalene synthase HpnC